MGLYIIRLPGSINVNQLGFSERGIHGLVAAEASQDSPYSSILQDDDTGQQSDAYLHEDKKD